MYRRLVSACAIGAKSEVRTAIALGGLPCTNFERALVRKEYRELSQELERLEALLDSPVKSSLLGKVRMKLSVSELKLKQLEEELAKGSEGDEKEGSGRMECGIAFAGTEITIGTEKLRLRQESRQCVAKLLCGEIVLM